MLAATLGPIAQRTLHRPLPADPSPSLLERGYLAPHQFEPLVASERLCALELSRSLVLRERSILERSCITTETSEIVLSPSAIEIRAGALRPPPSALAEERAVVRAPRESPAPEAAVQPFVMAVRELIETEQISTARHMLDAAPAYVLGDPLVARLRSVLAPPVVKRLQKRDVDRSQEYEWLRAHGREYRGRWVALSGGNLVASALTLQELQQQLRSTHVLHPPLLHRVD